MNLRGNSLYSRTDDGWEAYFPLLDVRVAAPTEDEVRPLLRKAVVSTVSNGTDEVKALWQDFCRTNIIEIDMTEEEQRAEDERMRVAAALADGEGSHFTVVTPDNFDQVVGGKQAVLIDFWAAWCQPCLQMIPVLEAYRDTASDKVMVASVDVEAHESLWQRFSLKGIPTMILFRSGEELGRVLGTRSLEELVAEVEALLR